MKKKIVLITCCRKKKCDHRPRPARDIYCAERFVAEREYAERVGGDDGWFILSAKHKLLSPKAEIESYDQTLSNDNEKKAWGETVFNMLAKKFAPHTHEFIILNDEGDYCKFLKPLLRLAGFRTHCPVEVLEKNEAIECVKYLNELEQDGVGVTPLFSSPADERKNPTLPSGS
ncbi:MAG: hypothetical protein OXU94_10970 [Gammaproteobacteria bacterium]|nr:hypothetical protein [Gammaproteobacteria bacterium]